MSAGFLTPTKLSPHEEEFVVVEEAGCIPLPDLLALDMSIPPANLFLQFNILHPYLSLHHLDYFTTMNKMNTKLFCTTHLMRSMMKENQQSGTPNANSELDMSAEEEDISQPITTNSLSYLKRSSAAQTVTNPIGYTIGATNALFKQRLRLLNDLDAFVSDVDVEIIDAASSAAAETSPVDETQGTTLKKQNSRHPVH